MSQKYRRWVQAQALLQMQGISLHKISSWPPHNTHDEPIILEGKEYHSTRTLTTRTKEYNEPNPQTSPPPALCRSV